MSSRNFIKEKSGKKNVISSSFDPAAAAVPMPLTSGTCLLTECGQFTQAGCDLTTKSQPFNMQWHTNIFVRGTPVLGTSDIRTLLRQSARPSEFVELHCCPGLRSSPAAGPGDPAGATRGERLSKVN